MKTGHCEDPRWHAVTNEHSLHTAAVMHSES